MNIAYQLNSVLRQDSSVPSGVSRRGNVSGDCIAREIAKLPEVQKRAIELYYVHRMSLIQTADRMNVSRTTAARSIARGLATLRHLLAKNRPD